MSKNRDDKGHWLPGNTGNPDGLGKPELAQAIAKRLSADDCAEFLIAIVRDGSTVDSQGRITDWSREDKRWAVDKLITRRWGKERQIVEVQTGNAEKPFDPAKLSTDALDRYAELVAALARDAERTEAPGAGGDGGDLPPGLPQVH